MGKCQIQNSGDSLSMIIVSGILLILRFHVFLSFPRLSVLAIRLIAGIEQNLEGKSKGLAVMYCIS